MLLLGINFKMNLVHSKTIFFYFSSKIVSRIQILSFQSVVFVSKITDGGWSNWSAWSSCSATCYNGTTTHSRLCNNPTPQNGGTTCSGVSQEKINCNVGPCIICKYTITDKTNNLHFILKTTIKICSCLYDIAYFIATVISFLFQVALSHIDTYDLQTLLVVLDIYTKLIT